MGQKMKKATIIFPSIKQDYVFYVDICYLFFKKYKDNLSKGFYHRFRLGFITHTFTAPIWFIKTRLQLNAQ